MKQQNILKRGIAGLSFYQHLKPLRNGTGLKGKLSGCFISHAREHRS